MNDGDWVESCTALVEDNDGKFEILYWADEVANREPQKPSKKKKRKDKDNPAAPVPVSAK